ncbi:hypothetical protein [Bradyrhizobium macuxiense]|uniref:hypothetical protein n=1 Tax=Bradyrhizobium macuxiense TaxID=1755647 RepID=UPI000835EF90|nr:hypothetical protein [Bradyrhizobium macuxiense]
MSAAAPAGRCRAEVLRSEELPYAPIGSWLLKATVRVTYPHGQTVDQTFLKNSPWQVTLRRGDKFWIDCERLRDTRPVALRSAR